MKKKQRYKMKIIIIQEEGILSFEKRLDTEITNGYLLISAWHENGLNARYVGVMQSI